jgi:protein tyrosine/serine phosphatase
VDQSIATFSAPSVFNFRDLGGHRTTDGRTVHYGRLYRSDSLHRLTDTECGQLCAVGVRTILDLRRPHEIERDGRIRETAGLTYHNIHPIHREWDPSLYVPEAGPARYLADRYLDMATEGAEGLGAALRLIADPANAPLVMHCFAGKDRTGVLSALTLSLLGVADDDIAAEYAVSERAQAALTAQIRADRSGTASDDAPIHFVVCPPEAMLLFLTELRERFGSVPGFVAHAGVTDGHVASLRAHLLA